MNRNIVIGLIVILSGVAAGWYVLSGKSTPALPGLSGVSLTGKTGTPTPTPVSLTTSTNDDMALGSDKGGVAARTVVTYTDTGFGPNSIVVKAGTIVTFVNESGKAMWVGSDAHPTHLLLPGFDQKKSVGRGETYEYAFAKVGTWGYHNHTSPTDTGSVVVTE